MTQRIACRDGAHRDRAVTAAAAALRRGDLVIIPTESVYAIAADAFSVTGVGLMRAAKGLDESASFAVLVPSATTVSGLSSRISDTARDLMTAFWPGLLTLQVPPQPTLAWSLPAQAPVAVRMPLHPLTLALLATARACRPPSQPMKRSVSWGSGPLSPWTQVTQLRLMRCPARWLM